jgi:hypothetical protein
MQPTEYKEMAAKIRGELEALEIQQEDTQRRIARLKQALIGLVPLAEPPDNASIDTEVRELVEATSLTDAVREILQASKEALAPVQIRDQLVNMGQDLNGQKNVMASVHSLLKRLVISGQIETKDDGLTYQWKGIRRFPRRDTEEERRRKVAAGRLGVSKLPR